MLAQLGIDGDNLLVAESRIGIKGMLGGMNQQCGHDQQYRTGGNLQTHQNLPRERLLLPLARDLQSGQQPEKQHRHHRDARREQQNPPVWPRAQPFRRVEFRQHDPEHSP